MGVNACVASPFFVIVADWSTAALHRCLLVDVDCSRSLIGRCCFLRCEVVRACMCAVCHFSLIGPFCVFVYGRCRSNGLFVTDTYFTGVADWSIGEAKHICS